jgi:hypothetical protein
MSDSPIYPHDPIEEIGPDVFLVRGSIKMNALRIVQTAAFLVQGVYPRRSIRAGSGSRAGRGGEDRANSGPFSPEGVYARRSIQAGVGAGPVAAAEIAKSSPGCALPLPASGRCTQLYRRESYGNPLQVERDLPRGGGGWRTDGEPEAQRTADSSGSNAGQVRSGQVRQGQGRVGRG